MISQQTNIVAVGGTLSLASYPEVFTSEMLQGVVFLNIDLGGWLFLITFLGAISLSCYNLMKLIKFLRNKDSGQE